MVDGIFMAKIALHVCSQHSFGLPLWINEMHRTQFDHACLDLLSLVIWSRVSRWLSVTWNLHKAHCWSKNVLTFDHCPLHSITVGYYQLHFVDILIIYMRLLFGYTYLLLVAVTGINWVDQGQEMCPLLPQELWWYVLSYFKIYEDKNLHKFVCTLTQELSNLTSGTKLTNNLGSFGPFWLDSD